MGATGRKTRAPASLAAHLGSLLILQAFPQGQRKGWGSLGSTGEVHEEGGFYSYLWLKSRTYRLTIYYRSLATQQL